MLISSGSALVALPGFGNSISGSRNQATSVGIVDKRSAVIVQMLLELRPNLFLDLLALSTRSPACRTARPAPPSPKCPPRGSRARFRRRTREKSTLAPELPLRNGRQRPRRIEIDGMAVYQRHILRKIKLDSVHPSRLQLAQVRQRGCGALEIRSHQRGHGLHRHGRDVEIGRGLKRTRIAFDRGGQ